MSTDTSGPAFPVDELSQHDGSVCAQHFGVTVRDYFAAKAMEALIAAPLVVGWVPDLYMVAIEGAFCAVQRVTSRYWAGEVPPQFCKCRPEKRDDRLNGGAA